MRLAFPGSPYPASLFFWPLGEIGSIFLDGFLASEVACETLSEAEASGILSLLEYPPNSSIAGTKKLPPFARSSEVFWRFKLRDSLFGAFLVSADDYF